MMRPGEPTVDAVAHSKPTSRPLIGMLVGWALWIALVAIAYVYDGTRRFVPAPLLGVTDFLMLGVGLAACPVGLGGWIWVWGDGGPPWWAKGWLLHVALGLAVFGGLGALGSSLLAHRRRGLALFCATAVIVLLLGVTVAAKIAL